MHERYLGQQFKKAERRHLSKFQENGKAINETLKRYAALGRALIDAKTQNTDPFAAVEGVLPWNELIGKRGRSRKACATRRIRLAGVHRPTAIPCSVAMPRSLWRLSSSGHPQGRRSL